LGTQDRDSREEIYVIKVKPYISRAQIRIEDSLIPNVAAACSKTVFVSPRRSRLCFPSWGWSLGMPEMFCRQFCGWLVHHCFHLREPLRNDGISRIDLQCRG